MNPRRIVAGYFACQAIAIAAWWGCLWWLPGSIEWFRPEEFPDDALLSFWLADWSLLTIGSAAVSVSVMRDSRIASILAWMLAATSCYPTLYCLAVSVRFDACWIATSMMVGLSGSSFAMATIQGGIDQTPAVIRPTEMTGFVAAAYTLLQTAIFWGAFLWVFPRGIMEAQDSLAIAILSHAGQQEFALTFFVMASLLGLWSGITIARQGRGTPLPTATAPQLVVHGPYRWVRNPMAIAGIVQGIAVGWYHGSVLVIGYAVCGAVLWHTFVRPIEEGDLEDRFQNSYREYRRNTPLWIPILRQA